MSQITIIAGPPGIGKSTYARDFLPACTEVIKKDEIIQAHKAFNYKLFQEIALQKWLSDVEYNLMLNRNVTMELNLGLPHEYSYVIEAKETRAQNELNVILFFTDDLGMCKERAARRFENGQHYVNPAVLENMYHNTLPLLKFNFEHLDNLTLVDVKNNEELDITGIYNKERQSFEIFEPEPLWFRDDLKPFIEKNISSPAHFYSR